MLSPTRPLDRAAPCRPPVCSAGEQWGALTDRMVSFSTIPFLFLFLPQLAKNYVNLASGNTAALAVLSWLVRSGSQQSAREPQLLQCLPVQPEFPSHPGLQPSMPTLCCPPSPCPSPQTTGCRAT